MTGGLDPSGREGLEVEFGHMGSDSIGPAWGWGSFLSGGMGSQEADAPQAQRDRGLGARDPSRAHLMYLFHLLSLTARQVPAQPQGLPRALPQPEARAGTGRQ